MADLDLDDFEDEPKRPPPPAIRDDDEDDLIEMADDDVDRSNPEYFRPDGSFDGQKWREKGGGLSFENTVGLAIYCTRYKERTGMPLTASDLQQRWNCRIPPDTVTGTSAKWIDSPHRINKAFHDHDDLPEVAAMFAAKAFAATLKKIPPKAKAKHPDMPVVPNRLSPWTVAEKFGLVNGDVPGTGNEAADGLKNYEVEVMRKAITRNGFKRTMRTAVSGHAALKTDALVQKATNEIVVRAEKTENDLRAQITLQQGAMDFFANAKKVAGLTGPESNGNGTNGNGNGKRRRGSGS